MSVRASLVCCSALAALALAFSLPLGCSSLGGGSKDVAHGCEAGFHACGGDCLPDASPLSCGTRCEACPVPLNGAATCGAGGCGISCSSGWHPCGGACADDASVVACGTGCETCPAPGHEHSRAACLAGSCGYSCDLGWFPCASGCCAAPRAAAPGLSLGDLSSCAIDGAGVLRCWGSNELGELGIGSMSPDVCTTPRRVAGFAAGEVVQVGVGFRHACAVDGAGAVRCWGGNGFGELGDGTFVDTATPVATPVTGAVSAGGGWEHSCALLGNGTVRCWGIGEHGVLGDGHVYGGAVPGVVTVKGLATAFALLPGYQFNCALTGLASMVCWGDNTYRQLGTTQAISLAAEPVDADALTSVTALRAVAVGMQHACAAYDGDGVSGGVLCWGRGDSGQLGNGLKPVAQATPVPVTGLSGVTMLAAGVSHTCALTSAGGVQCWGANTDGQLGDGTWSERLAPEPVSGLSSGVIAIAAGTRHTCAVVGSGGVATGLRCWGWNDAGQLGDGTRFGRSQPVPVVGF